MPRRTPRKSAQRTPEKESKQEVESKENADLQDRCSRSLKRTFDMFTANYQHPPKAQQHDSSRIRVAAKVLAEYGTVQALRERVALPGSSAAAQPQGLLTAGKALLALPAPDQGPAQGPSTGPALAGKDGSGKKDSTASVVDDVVGRLTSRDRPQGISSDSLVEYQKKVSLGAEAEKKSRGRLAARAHVPTPGWHAPWKLMRVISGHLGWVRSIAVEPGNQWFATGASDRTIKIWDLASGTLKLTLTGHINCIRGLAVSPRHPYMFSAGEDKMVKCWDLEYNKAIRSYHGHLSGVYALALHPTQDVLFTAGRDAVCRVWDIRTRAQVHAMSGHKNTIVDIATQGVDPQVVTSSMDCTVRLWDLAAGKSMATLTNHKKGVRALAIHPREFSFVSGAADKLKKWKFPDGKFMYNMEGHDTIIHSLSVNDDDVLVSAGDDGSMRFWDYKTGYCFQNLQTAVQPGSLNSEAGIYKTAFDMTGSRLITGEADKTIKIWKEDTEATPETHPVDMASWTEEIRRHKRY